MKRRKVKLDKKSIAKLTEENLDNVQGGGHPTISISLYKCGGCTNITIIETETPSEAESLDPSDIVLSCQQ